MVSYRDMARDELERIVEIDVSEDGTRALRNVNGQLETIAEHWRREPWGAENWCHGSWTTVLPLPGIRICGAFDGEPLVGIAVLRPHLAPDMAQLAAMYVSRTHRRQGIARRLMQLMYECAIATGARSIYVSATPSESAVGFYQSEGFILADQVNPELHALEPDDIHMSKRLV